MKDPTALKIERWLRDPTIFFGALAVLGVLVVAVLWLALPLYRGLLASQLAFSIIVTLVILFLLLGATALCILAERKISAYVQDRVGPNRAGFLGLLQPVADGLKFLLKEDIIPGSVDRPLYVLAPGLSFGIALLGFAVIPWAGQVHWPWMPAEQTVSAQVANLDVGFLYIVAIASMSVYGVVLAGYASNNKYAFYGGMRAAAQMISYEIPVGLGLLCILLTAGSLRLDQVVADQARSGLWYVFYQPLAFLLLFVGGLAETNRLPFDLAEAEQELVGGYHTEYSALKFGMFFLGEYAHMIVGSALMIALFFGGWHLWLLPGPDNTAWWAMLIKFAVYWAKIAVFISLFMLVRWTLPRYRFDQLMRRAWQSFVPLGLALVLATAVLVMCGWARNILACWIANAVVLMLMILRAAMSPAPVTGREDSLLEMEVRQ